MWPFKTEHEYKKCSRCKEWGASFNYGDIGQLCWGCEPWAGKEYRIRHVISILVKLKYVWLVLLILTAWNYREIIELYNYVCISITSSYDSALQTVKSWMFFK